MSTLRTLYWGGSILTMDAAGSVVEAVVTEGDRIVAVGTRKDMEQLAGADAQVVDLDGKALLPGFIDAHSHFLVAGLMGTFQVSLASPPVGGVQSLTDILDALRAKAKTLPAGQWVVGYGYDDTLIKEGRHPTVEDLDAVSTEHPVYARHVSGHIGVANTMALRLAGYHDGMPNPVGGNIRRDANGKLTGILEEPPATHPVQTLSMTHGVEDWMKAAAFASASYTAKGVTTAHDGSLSEAQFEYYKLAHERGILLPRMHLLPRRGVFDFAKAPTTQSGTALTPDNMLVWTAAKLLADGSLQGYTGFLSNPYHDFVTPFPEGELYRGYPVKPRLKLMDIVRDLHRDGWQIAVHGNGDDAIQNILDAFEEAQKAYPRADARHVIIHCQTVREDQLDRIQRLGVVPSFFVVHTYYWGDRHASLFLGPDRAARINPLKSALKRGIRFTNHNDTYVTPIDPLLSVWSAVNRVTSSGKVLGAAQCIPVLDALRSVTSWAAYQHHEEQRKGSLEPGKLADMVILGENPLAVDPMHIKDIAVEATIIGGKTVYSRNHRV